MLEPIWIWGILGLVLLAAEMATGTLYILWFGIAALCMSAALALFPLMALPLQLLLFAVLALGSLAIWKLNEHVRVAVVSSFQIRLRPPLEQHVLACRPLVPKAPLKSKDHIHVVRVDFLRQKAAIHP